MYKRQLQQLAELVEVGPDLSARQWLGVVQHPEELTPLQGRVEDLPDVVPGRLGVEIDQEVDQPAGDGQVLRAQLGQLSGNHRGEREIAVAGGLAEREPAGVAHREGGQVQAAQDRLRVGGIVDGAEESHCLLYTSRCV